MIVFLLILALCLPLHADDMAHYLKKLQAHADLIQDIQVDISVRSRMPGLTIPDRSASYYFKRPGKMRLMGEDFTMVPKEALMMDFSSLADSLTTVSRMRPDSLAGSSRILLLFSRTVDNRITTTRACIDTLDWTVETLDIDEGKSFRSHVTFHYTDVNGISVPDRIRADVESSRMQRRVRNPRSGSFHAGGSDSESGYIEIKFNHYRINQGLDDKLFEDGSND